MGIGVNHLSGSYGRHPVHSGRSFGYHDRNSKGIVGHRSFGLHNSPRSYNRFHSGYRSHGYPQNRFHSPHFKQPRRHDNHYQRHSGISLNIVAPIIASTSVAPYQAPVARQSHTPLPTSSATPQNNRRFLDIDAWAELGNYQTANAINNFKAQSRRDPKAAIPKVGFALATATDGEYDKAIWAMDLALRSEVSDLHYFRADNTLMLVLEELRLHYQDDAFMTASLLYLLQDFQAADNAVSNALTVCENCTSVENLQYLIDRQLL
jgi:hypothetical protein